MFSGFARNAVPADLGASKIPWISVRKRAFRNSSIIDATATTHDKQNLEVQSQKSKMRFIIMRGHKALFFGGLQKASRHEHTLACLLVLTILHDFAQLTCKLLLGRLA